MIYIGVVNATPVQVSTVYAGANDNFNGGAGGDHDNDDAIFSIMATQGSDLFVNPLGSPAGSFQTDPVANTTGTPYINGNSTDGGEGEWNSNAYIQCVGAWASTGASSGSPCAATPTWMSSTGGPAEFYFSGTGTVTITLLVDNPTVAAWWASNQFGIYNLNSPNTLIPEFGAGTGNWQGSSITLSLTGGQNYGIYESTNDGVCKSTVGQGETGCWTLYGDTVNTASAPEPASLVLIASGLIGLGVLRRRKR